MFDKTLRTVLASTSLSAADDLLGFKMDADAALAQEAGLEATSVEEGDDPECLLVLQGTVQRTIGTLAQVKEMLWHIWQDLSYLEFQAASIHLDPQAARLRFITASPPALCVTGEIRLVGEHYELLYRKDR